MQNIDGVNDILKQFKNPPSNYGLIPFWFWNDDLNKEHLLFQMTEMKNKGINEFIIHSRCYRTVEYLSEEWFDRVGYVLEKAKEMGMSVWIYDEDNWPSGYAGGKVLDDNPDCYAKCLIRVKGNDCVSEPAKLIKQAGEYTYYQIRADWHPAYNSGYYTDMLNPEATRLFMKYTHQEYLNRFGSYFGTTIKGFFTDETGFYNNFDFYYYPKDACSYSWTDDFSKEFTIIKGYDLLDKIDYLFNYDEDSLKTRLDYYEVLTKLYIKNYFNPIMDFCKTNHIELIGHVHSEEMLPYHVKSQGDMMKVISAMDIPGIDRIDLSREKITEKYASSTAHMYNKARTLSETFASSGLDINLQRIKFWTNYQYVRGINMMVPHAFFSSIEGDRKYESPPTLFYQNPYWKYFKNYADYTRRLSYLLSQGQFNSVAAIYYPITSQQELVRHDSIEDAIKKDRLFIEIGCELLDNQIDYDIVNSDGLSDSEISDGKLIIHGIKYSLIIIPDITNISIHDLKKIYEFASSGGGVVYIGKCQYHSTEKCDLDEFSRYKNAIEKSINFKHYEGFCTNKTYTYFFNGALIDLYCKERGYKTFALKENDPEIKYMHRSLGTCELYFIVNEGRDQKHIQTSIPFEGNIFNLNPYDGNLYEYLNIKKRKNGTELEIVLEPNSQQIIIIDKMNEIKREASSRPQLQNRTEELVLDGKWNIHSSVFNDKKHLDYWNEYGVPFYSGTMEYSISFSIDIKSKRKYHLELGKVYHTAELYLNERFVDNLVWEPYIADITDFINDGENRLKIVVSNTLGNEIAKASFNSGLLGDVKIISYL